MKLLQSYNAEWGHLLDGVRVLLLVLLNSCLLGNVEIHLDQVP